MKRLLCLGALLPLFFSCTENKPAPPKPVRQYTIEQFYQTKRTGAGLWSADEQRLLVQSDASGIFNL